MQTTIAEVVAVLAGSYQQFHQWRMSHPNTPARRYVFVSSRNQIPGMNWADVLLVGTPESNPENHLLKHELDFRVARYKLEHLQ